MDKAKDLRDNMKKIPQHTGLYKWYVEEDVFKELLEKLCGNYEE